jgi:hypothetical protein
MRESEQRRRRSMHRHKVRRNAILGNDISSRERACLVHCLAHEVRISGFFFCPMAEVRSRLLFGRVVSSVTSKTSISLTWKLYEPVKTASSAVPLVSAGPRSVTVGVCAARDCALLLVPQRELPRRDVVSIFQREKKTLQAVVAFPAVARARLPPQREAETSPNPP